MHSSMDRYKKEDAALLGMQFWLLVLSFVAVSDISMENAFKNFLTRTVADIVFFHPANVRIPKAYILLLCSVVVLKSPIGKVRHHLYSGTRHCVGSILYTQHPSRRNIVQRAIRQCGYALSFQSVPYTFQDSIGSDGTF